MSSVSLRIGSYEAVTPVVLAPMAGITNQAFRRLCREHGGGFYVSEMVTSRALLERNTESMRLVAFDPDEHPGASSSTASIPAPSAPPSACWPTRTAPTTST